MRIVFEIPGRVQGKARARTFYNAKLSKMMSITPEQTVNYENLIKMCFLQKRPKDFEIMKDGVCIEIKAYYRKAKGNKMPAPYLKPDADNIIKVILDSLNGIAYIDDKQVISVVMNKVWGEPEKVVVIVEEAPLF